jgi:hypothetical protein
MANNCFNWTSIKGDKSVLDVLEAKFKTFNHHNPIPFSEFCDSFFTDQRIEKSIEPYLADYSYGTKWWNFDVCRDADNYLCVQGDSAWSPPSEFLRRLSEHYAVEISNEYEEPGMDFGGFTNYKYGEEDDNCYSYNEWRYMNNPDGFSSDIEWATELYETFEEYKESVLDSFVNRLSEKEINEIKEEFNEYKSNQTK